METKPQIVRAAIAITADGQELTEAQETRLREIVTKFGGHVEGDNRVTFDDRKAIDGFITAVGNAGYSFTLTPEGGSRPKAWIAGK